MQKIIKNTIEDFTDDQEIVEIENLILEKKYKKALKKTCIYANEIDHKQQKKEANYKFIIINIFFVICFQYLDLVLAIFHLNFLNNERRAKSLGTLLLFSDILQKMENGYYEKENTKRANEYIAAIGLNPKHMINKIENQIQKILEENAKNLLGYIPTEIELVTEYMFNKFQKYSFH